MTVCTDEKGVLMLRALRDAKEAVDFRRATLAAALRKSVHKRISSRQFVATEKELTEALIPFFVEQGRSMAKRLREMGERKAVVSPDSARGLVQQLLRPKEWRGRLANVVLPVLARRMGEAAVAHLMTIGIDVRREKKSVKASTAAEWAEENASSWESLEEALVLSGESLGILTELPGSMKDSIAERLTESFAQDYWDGISETTMGDAERVLREGIAEGESIGKMARRLRGYFEDGGFRYARARSENIARTESANALNGARKDSVAGLQEELGPQVPMKQTWLSVLGNTTRATHANLDGVPEDENGMWNLSGYVVPWPGHISLPPEERCNCQCSLTIEFGMREDEAQRLINEYGERQEATSRRLPVSSGEGRGIWKNPTREQIAKVDGIYAKINADKAFDAQMRGGVLEDGRFEEFTAGTKRRNMHRIEEKLDELEAGDPEAFEAARQWKVAEQFGVESYDDVPEIVEVYRGHSEGEQLGRVVNVSNRKEISEKFGESGIVTTYKVNKEDISFSLSNSVFDEGELIIRDPKKVLEVVTEEVSETVRVRRILDSYERGQAVTLVDGRKGIFLMRGVGETNVVRLSDGTTNYAAVLRID